MYALCRYFVDGTSETLFERWFYCDDLGVQLVPVIKEFFASEQHRTGRPIKDQITLHPPYHPDATRVVPDAFSLRKWLESNRAEINQTGWKQLFSGNYQSDVVVHGKGKSQFSASSSETWIWQLVTV